MDHNNAEIHCIVEVLEHRASGLKQKVESLKADAERAMSERNSYWLTSIRAKMVKLLDQTERCDWRRE